MRKLLKFLALAIVFFVASRLNPFPGPEAMLRAPDEFWQGVLVGQSSLAVPLILGFAVKRFWRHG